MNTRKLVAIGLISAVLGGCGGSGSPTVAGIDGTGARSPIGVVSKGTVTGFGSVIVNGVRFDTSSTSFTIDGEPGSQSDLAVGDVVTVRGELDDGNSALGTATAIDFDDIVEGPVDAVDTASSSLTVLGQTVRVDASTSFDDSIQPPSLAGLSPGDVVEVSGFVAADGSISATRIEPKPASIEFELTGRVTALDPVNSRFNINGQVVDFSSAMLNDFDDGTIDEGELVEVKAGTALGSSGELIATRIEARNGGIGADDGERVEIEGFISRFVSLTDFDVAGFTVTSNGNPVIVGGVAADLGVNVKVEVEGTFTGGSFRVTRIEIRRSSAVRVVANVDSVDSASGEFTVLGITVSTDARTRFEDKGPDDLESFSLADLRVDDYVEVRGAELPAGSGRILAGLLERDDDDVDVELRGFVETGSVADPVFQILGVTVSTGGGTVFRDASGSVISAADFFSIAEGLLVDVDGTEVGDRSIVADEVEIEQ